MSQLRHFLIALFVAAGLAPAAAVAQVTWTGTTGNGDWATAGAFADSSGGITLSNGFSQAFVFAGTPAIVSTTNTLTGGTASSFTFNSGAAAYTLSGNAITLGGNITNNSTSLQTISMAMSSAATRTITLTAGGGGVTLSGALSGAGGYTLGGTGTLTLTASNSYAGTTTVNSGQVLVLGSGNALGTGTLSLNAGSLQASTDIRITNAVSVAAGYAAGVQTTFSGSRSIELAGPLTVGNNLRNSITASSGTLTLSNGSMAPFLLYGSGATVLSGTVSGAGTMTLENYDANGTVTVTGRVQSGALQLGANGSFGNGFTLILTDSNSVAASTLFNFKGGRLRAAAPLTLQSSLVLVRETSQVSGTNGITISGTFNPDTAGKVLENTIDASTALTLQGPVVIGSSLGSLGWGFQSTSTGNVVISGTMSGGSATTNTNLYSSGTFSLLSANTYSGTTVLGSGATLVLGNNAALGTSTLNLAASSTVRASTAVTTTNAIFFGTNGSNLSVAGTNSIGFGSLTNVTATDRILTNNLASNATLTFSGTVAIQEPAGSTNRFLTVSGSGNTTFSGPIVNGGASGVGSLTVNSTGTTTLSAANTYTGLTTGSAGVLALSGAGSLLSTGTVSVAGTAATFDISAASGGRTIGMLTGTFASASVVLGNNTLTVGDATSGTFSGIISGGGGLTKSGTGTFALAGANIYTGTTRVNAGTLVIGGSTTTGLLPAASAVTGSAGATLMFSRTDSHGAIGNTISGGLGVTVVNSGTVTLTGSNSYTGPTTLSGGVLVIGNANALGSGVLVLNTGTFDVTPGSSFTITNSSTLAENTFFNGSGNLTMSGTLSMLNNRTLSTQGSGTLTLASIGGTRPFLKAGAGTLVVSGSSSLSSNFQLTGSGTVILSHPQAIGSGTLRLGNVGQAAGTLRPGIDLTISNPTALEGDTTLAGTNSLTFSGTYAQTATGVRALTNNLDPTAGALLKFDGPFVLQNNVPTAFAGSGNTRFSGTISGGASGVDVLRLQGTGTTTLLAANTYSGTTTFSGAGGTLVLGNDAALGSSVLLLNTSSGTVRASATLTATNTIFTLNDVNFGGTNSMTFGALTNAQTSDRIINSNLAADKTLTFSGTTTIRAAADGNNRTLTVSGSGNTAFNNTIVNGGTAGVGNLTINSTGTTTVGGSNTFTGTLRVNAGVLLVTNTAATTSSNLRIETGGVVGLAAGDFTAALGSGAGQVQMNSSGGFAAFGADRIVAIGGTASPTALTFGGASFLPTTGTFSLGASGATAMVDFRNNIDLAAGGTRIVRVDDGPAAVEGTISGVLSNTANLTKIGQGALRLTAANTYSGATTVQSGILIAGTNALASANGAFGNASSAIVLGNGSTGAADAPTILIGGTFTVGRAISVGSVANANAYTAVLGGTNTSGTATFSGNVTLDTQATNYGLTLQAAPGGTVNLTGAWTTNNRAITVGSDGNTGTILVSNTLATTGGVTVSNGTLRVGNGGTAGALSNTSPVSVATGATVTFDRSDAVTYSGTVTGAGSLTKVGASTLTLDGAQSYTGATTITAGTLQVGSGGSTGSLSNSSPVSVAASTAIAFNRSNALTYGGTVTGAGGLTKLGNSTLTLDGGQNYTGATTITAGTLQIGNGGSTGSISNSSPVSVAASTALAFNRSDAVTYSGTVSGAGGLTKLGASTLTLDRAQAYTGTTSIVAGTVRLNGSGQLQSSARIDVASGASLIFDRTDGYGGAYNGNLAGAGSVSVEKGSLNITGVNAFTGTTTVLSGAVLDLDGRIDNTSLSVNQGATLMGTGSSAGLTTIAGVHNPGNSSPGIQSFDSLTYESTSLVNWDLWANDTIDPGFNYDQILLTGSLTFNAATQFNLVFDGGGSGVDWSDAFWDSNQQWLVYNQSPAGGVLPMLTSSYLDPGNQELNFVTGREQAFFKLVAKTGGVYLVYQAPEPGSLALAGIGLAAAAAMQRRLRKRRQSH